MANRTFSELSTREKLLLPFNSAVAVLDLAFSVPLAGRLGKWVWNSGLTLGFLVTGLLEFFLWQVSIRPIKKLRIGFLVLSDEDGKPLVKPSSVMIAVEYLQQAYLPAHVKVIPTFPRPKRLSESGEEEAGLNWMRVIPASSSKLIREVGCDRDAVLQDLGLPGSSFQFNTLRQSFHTSFRRNSGVGAPVMVFVVDKIPGFGGCSMGWLSDYVTVIAKSLKTTAHEVGHACNLPHHKVEDNLMHPSSVNFDIVHLTTWQIILLRASRHVTII